MGGKALCTPPLITMDGFVTLAAQNIVVAAFLTFFMVIIPTIAIVTAGETKR